MLIGFENTKRPVYPVPRNRHIEMPCGQGPKAAAKCALAAGDAQHTIEIQIPAGFSAIPSNAIIRLLAIAETGGKRREYPNLGIRVNRFCRVGAIGLDPLEPRA